jgi:small subunit ribosomal protein S6
VRYYEAIYIAHPNLEQEGLTKLIDETKSILEKRGGEILYEEILGKKRLAYSIQKQRFGTYVLLQFRGDGSGNARLNQDLELVDNILAHMVVRIDEDDIRESREEETAISEDVSSHEDKPEDEVDESEGSDESDEEEEDQEEDQEAEETEDIDTSVEEPELEPEEEK